MIPSECAASKLRRTSWDQGLFYVVLLLAAITWCDSCPAVSGFGISPAVKHSDGKELTLGLRVFKVEPVLVHDDVSSEVKLSSVQECSLMAIIGWQ